MRELSDQSAQKEVHLQKLTSALEETKADYEDQITQLRVKLDQLLKESEDLKLLNA